MLPNQDYEDLRRIGDALEGDLRASFLQMVDAVERMEDFGSFGRYFLEAVQTGNTAAIANLAEQAVANGIITNSLEFMNIIYAVMAQAATATFATTTLTLPVREEVLNTVRSWSMRRGAERVTGISLDTVASMRLIMEDAIKRGVGAEQLGRELRSSVGMLPSHETAWKNYTAELRRRNLPQPTIERLSNQYRRRLIAWRAEMISRTETMYAVHAGQMAGWVTQAKLGILQPQRTWIEWVVTEDDRLCDRCAPMDGQRVRFGFRFKATERGFPDGVPEHADSPYDRKMRRRGPLRPRIPLRKAEGNVRPWLNDDGTPKVQVFHPPLHPNCRCTMRLRFD